MHRIFHLPMRPKLRLDILIPEQPHLRGKMLPVCAEETAVEIYRREKGHRSRGETIFGGHG
jgi:hypothetical protein